MSRRGMSLAEMLIVIAVMMVLSSVLFFILVAGKSSWLTSDADVDMHNKLARTLNEMFVECKHSDPNTLTIGTSPTAMGFYTNDNGNGTYALDSYGNPIYGRLIVYYLQASTKYLRKREIAATFSSALTAAQLRSYCDGSGRVMADAITTFTIKTSGPQFATGQTWGVYAVLATTITTGTGDQAMGGRQMFAAPWY